MKFLYFNARGVVGTPKLLSLKHLCVVVVPDVILIQETMCSGLKSEEFFKNWLKG
jgi:hypothetical protein